MVRISITTIGQGIGLNPAVTKRLSDETRIYLRSRTGHLPLIPDEVLEQWAEEFLKEQGPVHFPDSMLTPLKWSIATQRRRIVQVVTDIMTVQRKYSIESLHRKGPCTGCIEHLDDEEARTYMPPLNRDETTADIGTTPDVDNADMAYEPAVSSTATTTESGRPELERSDPLVLRYRSAEPREATVGAFGAADMKNEHLTTSIKDPQPPACSAHPTHNDQPGTKRKRVDHDSHVDDYHGSAREDLAQAIYNYGGKWYGFVDKDSKISVLEWIIDVMRTNIETERLKVYTHHLAAEDNIKSIGAGELWG